MYWWSRNDSHGYNSLFLDLHIFHFRADPYENDFHLKWAVGSRSNPDFTLGTCAQSTYLTSFDILHSTFSCPIVYEDGKDQMTKTLQGTVEFAARESEGVGLHTAFPCCRYYNGGQTFNQFICLVANMFWFTNIISTLKRTFKPTGGQHQFACSFLSLLRS